MSTGGGEKLIENEKHSHQAKDEPTFSAKTMGIILFFTIFNITDFIFPKIGSALIILLTTVVFGLVMHFHITICLKVIRLYFCRYWEFICILYDDVKQVYNTTTDRYFKYCGDIVTEMSVFIEKIKLIAIGIFDKMTTTHQRDVPRIKKIRERNAKVSGRGIDRLEIKKIIKELLNEELFEKNQRELKEMQKSVKKFRKYMKDKTEYENMMQDERDRIQAEKLEAEYHERDLHDLGFRHEEDDDVAHDQFDCYKMKVRWHIVNK
jgi:hypothetical protein